MEDGQQMRLIEEILSDANLNLAIERVKRNKGACGIDKMPITLVETYFRENLTEIRTKILEKQYRPQPVRRVYIPKSNGKLRPLGIPTVVDRVIQQSIAQKLTPIYENIFSDYSYGFRPGRDCHTAMNKVLEYLNEGYEWVIDLVPSGWPNDPEKIVNGKLKIPSNLWYIGTINNDDSTFMVTDKVYDRAMPIDINIKVNPFKCREQEAVNLNASYLENLFEEAKEKHPLSEKGLADVKEVDDYVIKHFRIAFGNRIMKQLGTFVAIYVACGGKEVEAIDYFIAKKILRKFDQLSVAFIRDEIDPFITYLNKKFGKNVMKECIDYLENLKKSI